MNKILVLWAMPRSRSTAFEWMMRERGDFVVLHEPFGEAYYHGADRWTQRAASVAPHPAYSYANVWRKLRAQAEGRKLFMKDFALHLMHMADGEFLSHFEHTFLIRDPAEMLPSLYDQWPDFTIHETGYRELYELFERVRQREDRIPPVIDAGDLVTSPEPVVRAYCEAVGIRFIPEALRWRPGARSEVSWYDGGSWHGYLQSSQGLRAQPSRRYLPVDANEHLRDAYAICRPYYRELFENRLRIV
ncbi:MAG: sulfotransferase family protein [Gammaproteobacteria bacterium]|nr:sulfotransferase family protein [Gammaproteobacteria bacterium]NIR82635.1 sulfotransferase family protein [Gammaproteobacteria bacterium]NIR89098.1 sulfotransferase family protein [Gammaproteobacteria bacterium]NIU03794.1 sulfotransferase family protein [Gammaproteobacteria bacterium]NIV51131.1 sulfotransferase family protein [Gammaproteobacteria bacterium]